VGREIDAVDTAIIGGGVSGLAAAYESQRRQRSFVVLEREPRPGGIIQTERAGDFIIDSGPDALLVQKPAAVALCTELGLGNRLVPTKVPRTAFILRHGRLHPLPGSSILGFPTRLKPLLTSTLFSPSAKVRMALEPFIPARRGLADESIAAFVRRRFGIEAVKYVAEPLLAGIHAGDVDRLSVRSLFPRLVEAEATVGSVMKAFRSGHAASNPDGVFRSFPEGLAELIHALIRAIPNESVRLSSRVVAIREDGGDGYTLFINGQANVRARSVILAIPGFAAADLLRPVDSDLAAACDTIQYLSTAVVVFAFSREAVRHPLNGTGFVVPQTEGLAITAAAWISSKWPHRAPEGQALIRAFLGGARDPNVLSKTDHELATMALDDLKRILDIRSAPALTRVYRWNKASPQQEVGHTELMNRIDAKLATRPGLFISAAGFRGVGIPDCIADARGTAEMAADFIKRR
jgi:protoporphyrinogen/coproporphyrinogen III oxidase